jgi:UDP-glucose-4-epimerase GalE
VGESVAAPQKYVRNNVVGTSSLLEAVLEEGVRWLVFSSTAAVYGTPAEVPIKESALLLPINPYGESKRYIEEMLRSYGRAYGLSSVALRYFNAAGADPAGETGEIHDPESHLVPLAIRAALGDAPPLSIMGTDYPTPDGTAIRDYVHVTDLAVAHVKALAHLRSNDAAMSLAMNLGTGRGHSVLEVVAAVERVTGTPVPRKLVARRAGDPTTLVADPTEAARTLGFAPALSSLDDIVQTATRWHRARLDRTK